MLSRVLRRHLICALLAVMGVSSFAADRVAAEDWPQWRGPQHDGASRETLWNARWGTQGPAKLWEAQVGAGYGTVSVQDGRLYTMGYDDHTQSDVIYCFNALSGEILWTHSYPIAKHDKMHGGGPACTPSVDGERLYIVNREAQVYCLSTKDGSVLWSVDLKQTHNAKIPTWAIAGSPLVLDDMLIVDVGPTVALNKETGQPIWGSNDYGAAYSSPVPFTHKGRKRLAVFPEFGLVILDPQNGRELAKTRWETAHGVNAATPLVIDDEHIFISSGYRQKSGLFRFTGNALREVWRVEHLGNKMDSSVYHNGYLYGMNDAQRGTLQCVDARTGELKWTRRDTGNGTVALAGDVLIVLTERGEVVTAQATHEAFRPISQQVRVLHGDRPCWIVPVLSHGLLYVRNPEGHLICLDLRIPDRAAQRVAW